MKIVAADDKWVSDQALQQARSLISQKVTAVVGPSLVGSCQAIAPLMAANGPVNYCLSPAVNPTGYQWSVSATTQALADETMKYWKSKGITSIAVVNSTDASGARPAPRRPLRLSRRPDRPTALLVESDAQASGRWPTSAPARARTSAVITLEGTDLAHFTVPSLTSVSQPIRTITRAAVEAVLAEGPERVRRVNNMDFELVLRETCGHRRGRLRQPPPGYPLPQDSSRVLIRIAMDYATYAVSPRRAACRTSLRLSAPGAFQKISLGVWLTLRHRTDLGQAGSQSRRI